MSYSNSEKAVQKVAHFLDVISSAKGDSITWTSSNSVAFAYQLRQAIVICNKYKEKYPDFYSIKDNWRIKVKGNAVTASRVVPIAELQEVEVTADNFTKTVAVFEVQNVKGVMEVIGAILENPNYEEYLFSDYTEISDKELHSLYKWTSRNSHYIVNSSSLIITKKQPKEDIQWTPILKAM